MKSKLVTFLLAVLFACGLWLFVVTVEQPESEQTYYEIPVIFQNNGEELLTEKSDTEYTLSDFDPDKTYEMKLVGYTEDRKTKSPENVQTFEIGSEKMSTEEAIDAACDWGVDIAEDDSFTYGECPQALHNGCYFCKTNGKKGKGYEKN